MTDEKITAFKGFDKDMKCRGFQYEVGKTYEHEGVVEACRSGFHACENPFDVWEYYDIYNSRFAAVTMHGETSKDGIDSKISSGKITIEAEISMPKYVRKCVDWVIEKTKGKNDSGNYAKIGSSGYSARIGSSGHYAQIGSSGHYAQIGSSGHYAKIGSSGRSATIGSSGRSAQIGSSGDAARIGSSGYSARIGSSGHYAQIGSSGHYAQIGSSGRSATIGSSGRSARIGSSGDSAQIGSSGDAARIGSSGHSARIGSSGHYARISVEGKRSVVALSGCNATVQGVDGTWVAIAEYNESGECVGFATGCIGKDGLEASVTYKAKGGKLVKYDE